MKSLSQEEAIAILNDMKIDIPVPKAAVTQRKRNVALDMAISAMSCCEIYGHTASEATDWAQKWPACGLKDKPYNGDRAIIEVIMHEKKKASDSQIDGQMTLEL